MTSRATLTRRHFLVTLSAAGGMAVGFAAPAAAAAIGAAPSADEAPTPQEINAWIVIDPDDTVTIRLPHAEIGQGAATALPMIVAEELACDWAKVRVVYASPSRNMREHGVYGAMMTVGSRGVRTSVQPLQQAGAAARARLIAAAAKRWNVDSAACEADTGAVVHSATKRRLSYGQLAHDAAKVTLAAEPAVKSPDAFTVIGKPYPRIDTPLKVDGSATFPMDVRLPGMAYAAVTSCPVPGGTLKSVEAGDVAKRPGILAVVPMTNAVVVVAEDTWWRAKQALDALTVTWDYGAGAGTDSAQFAAVYRDALKGDGVVAEDKGKLEDGMAAAARRVEATYEVPFVSHAPMEPMNATARFNGDRLELWVGSQGPVGALQTAAKAAGLPPENITIHNLFVGGGFGRKSQHDEIPQAIAAAKAVNRPVKLIWSREQDIQQDRYRPQAALMFRGGLGADGLPVAMEIRTAVGSLLRSLGIDKVEKGVEPMAVEGLVENPYGIHHQRIRCTLHNTHVPVAFWRSVGSSQNAFAIESFIDEMAHAAGKDPAAFRRALIKRPDFLGVLDTLVAKSDWGKPLPAGRGRGIAIHECYGSIVGQAAEVTVSTRGDLKVDRVVAVVDCGHVVNPRIVEAQIQGGVIWGLSAALYGEITVRDGRIAQSNFTDFRVATMTDAPDIEVHFALSGGAKWGGIGEPGVAPAAPAVCNAIFAATGKRIRRLPIKGQLTAREV